MWRGEKHTNGQRRERERERERERKREKEREREAGRIVTVCDVLVTAVTHCNGVGLYVTGSISHGTNIRSSTRPL